jgi:type I restriction enzyme S subunit
MNAWRKLTLTDVAEVTAGNPAPQEPGDFADHGTAFVRMQDVGRLHHTKSLTETTDKLAEGTAARYRLRLFPQGTLLIPKSGASVNLNHRALLGADAYVVSHLATVVPDRRVIDPEFLYYWSLTYDPRHHAQTTSLPSLPISLIKAASIALPPLDEQRRIVDLLSRAEGIVRLRREAQTKAAEIIPALFFDMFGDPATNAKGWKVVSLSDVADVQGGLQVTSARSALPLERPYLRVANVYRAMLDLSEIKTIRLTEAEYCRTRLQPGDLLFVEGHGNPQEVGRVAVWDGSIAGCTHQNHLIRARPHTHVLLPTFACYLLNSWGGRQALLCAGKTTSGLSTISAQNVRDAKVLLPPIEHQARFEERCRSVFGIAAQQAEGQRKAEATFQALLARAFGGDLLAVASVEEAAVA